MNLLNQMGPVVAVALVFLLAAVIGLSVLSYKMYNKLNKIETAYRRTFRVGRGKILEDLIAENLQIMEEASTVSKEVAAKMEKLESDMARAIQNVGMVRYRAFKDMGPELSFSLALLDAHKDGVIITNIFGGSNCSVYSKPIKDGKSDFLLSLEEKEALEIAMSDKPSKIPEPAKKPTLPGMIAAVVANNILAPKN
ncbi:DUF4446 family protein [Proteiniclasticum sp. QWL-01]|jgi:hypothetical protein|uniref:DUF4446 family protein n=1 Tax=Proteiniclasticum sp. QWL-01 TaxID=3036945 RepID=UPI0024104614|nr:DUF4446 family protein [Proteiniclasticum sp. QWL-01]WFF72931.1 DUF4446 family protein [Proteiniclasticum sp. QWL-01]